MYVDLPKGFSYAGTTWKFPEKLTVKNITSLSGLVIFSFKSLEWKVFCFPFLNITHPHTHTCTTTIFLLFGAVLEKKNRPRVRNNPNVIIQIYKIFMWFRKFKNSEPILKRPFLLGSHIYQNEFFSLLSL